MTPKYRQFVFSDYRFDPASKEAIFTYKFDDSLTCSETFRFDFAFADYDKAALDRALQLAFYLVGISYYKMYIPPAIRPEVELDAHTAALLTETYTKGLGEFFYVNGINPKTRVPFTGSDAQKQMRASGKGMLVGIGGGKDSLVSIELLRESGIKDIATWSLGHKSQLKPLVARIGLPHYHVERRLDPQVTTLNKQDALNGHIPISAIFAAIGCVVAILTGKQDVVVSNEQSANEPSLTYEGVEINHQYSKSQAFERSFQQLLRHHFGESLWYYSLLRPFSEVRIAEFFGTHCFGTYKDVFSSCNRAFVQGSNELSWCGKCAKCAFVFLILTPFVDRKALEGLFGGKNLLLDPSLSSTYDGLLGIDGDKPLECVGEVRECRLAYRKAQQLYPERLAKEFLLDENYDYKALFSHELPKEIADAAIRSMNQ